MAGIDVVKHPGQVRRYIGVAALDVTLDPLLTGRQNLVIVGELSGMGRAASRTRAPQKTIGMVSAAASDAGLRRVVKEKFRPANGGFPEGVLERAVARGEVRGTQLARQTIDEVVYPLATPPAARTCKIPTPLMPAAGASHMNDRNEVRARRGTP